MTSSELIDEMLEKLNDWRADTLRIIRKVIKEADPEVVEEWKWRGAPVWSHNGIICVANAFKDKVKMTFNDGASLQDPDKLFNNGLDGNKWRSIDLYEDDKVREDELKSLVRCAVELNQSKAKIKKKAAE